MYRKEFLAVIQAFFDTDQDFDVQTKLKAQDEYEKLREALTVQSVFEA
jgi:hypothetical protein